MKTLHENLHVHLAEEARTALESGYCPVECAFGVGESVVDGLRMDHHGDLSALEGVAVRAYRDHFGARANDPRFVVTGAGDADTCFAIAALAGLLPHPSRADEFASAPPPVRASHTRDLSTLAALVNRIDTEPIGVDLSASEEGRTLLLWNQLTGSMAQDALQFQMGVGLWVRLTAGRPLPSLLAAAGQEEASRREAAALDLEDSERFGAVLCLRESKTWGFDVWYETAPCVLARTSANGNITVGCRDQETAEALFGPGGLKNAFEALGEVTSPGWGGREAVGGSPRGMKMSRGQAKVAAQRLAELVRA